MLKKWQCLSFILTVMFTLSVITGCSVSQTQTLSELSLATTTTLQFIKIEAPLTLNGEEPGTDIPSGSTVYHWANGITEVYGPDNELVFIAKDAEAAMLPHPSGPNGPFESPATHILQLPDGANIDEGIDGVTKIYSAGELIVTIINKSEDYKY